MIFAALATAVLWFFICFALATSVVTFCARCRADAR